MIDNIQSGLDTTSTQETTNKIDASIKKNDTESNLNTKLLEKKFKLKTKFRERENSVKRRYTMIGAGGSLAIIYYIIGFFYKHFFTKDFNEEKMPLLQKVLIV